MDYRHAGYAVFCISSPTDLAAVVDAASGIADLSWERHQGNPDGGPSAWCVDPQPVNVA